MNAMANATLSPRAEQDMREIWHYSVETWSERQAQTYSDALFDIMEDLAKAPERGQSAQDIAEGLRRQRCQSHVIFYRLVSDGVLIVRVLHQNMDFATHLANDET